MKRAESLSSFLEDPLGRYLVGGSWVYFCAHPELFGIVLWGAPNGHDIGALVPALVVEFEKRIPPHRSLVDARRVDRVDAAAFQVFQGHIAAHGAVLSAKVQRLALIRPGGLAGATVAGFYEVVPRPPYPVQLFDRPEDSLAWLGPPATQDLLAELDAIVTGVTGVDPIVGALRTFVEARLTTVTLDEAAKALGLSGRTLQRRLGDAGTSFQKEVGRVRVEVAKRLMATSDSPLGTIALEVGCASQQHFSALFRRLTGEPPRGWRERIRATTTSS